MSESLVVLSEGRILKKRVKIAIISEIISGVLLH